MAMYISINFQPLSGAPKHSSRYSNKCSLSVSSYSFNPTTTTKTARGLKACATTRSLSFFGVNRGKYEISMNRVVVVKSNKDGGKVSGETARVLGNLGVAILLTYLSMTGQLGWVVDAIVSIWLVMVLVPIIGIGAFLWWSGRDIVQSSCPNCGNEFQVFKSTLNEELQLCPFCTQPFSVADNEFVSDRVKFSNQSTTFDQGVSDFSTYKNKRRDSSMAVVDVEAEIRDAE